jgi:hypothetical protein
VRFLQEPHDAASQKMAFFIITAVKTSNVKIIFKILIFWAGVTGNLANGF